MFKDHYRILEVQSTASKIEIRKSYRQLALKYHPDKTFNNKALEEKFKEVQYAYEILSDEGKRSKYDVEYNKHYKKDSKQEKSFTQSGTASSAPPPVTPFTFLKLFRDLKNNTSNVAKSYSLQNFIFDNINSLLTDSNIAFLRTHDNLTVNREIIEIAIECSKKLDYRYWEKLSVKLVKLAGTDNESLRSIFEASKKQRVNSYYQKIQRGFFYFLVTILMPYFKYIFWGAVILFIVVEAITSSNTTSPVVIVNRPQSGNLYNDSLKSDYTLPTKPKEINYDDWDKTNYATGNSPGCYNFIGKYNKHLDNKLEVSVGDNTDAVIKLIDNDTKKCIRYIYVRSGETYSIRHIPQGLYYLKIAYGRDWRQKIINGKCVGKFIFGSLYKKGENILNFYKKDTGEEVVDGHTYTTYSIPSYSLKLDVVTTDRSDQLQTNGISEEEFND